MPLRRGSLCVNREVRYTRKKKSKRKGSCKLEKLPSLYSGHHAPTHSSFMRSPRQLSSIRALRPLPRDVSILLYPYKLQARPSIVVYLLQSMSMLPCDFPTSCSGRPVSCPFSPPRDVAMHVLPSISKVMSPQIPCKSTG
jgi:hypothetical protein